MLVLQRKANQQLRIGDAVVTILRISEGIVRLGIAAPPHIAIVRDDAKQTTPPSPPSRGRHDNGRQSEGG